jgi:hypothetical protein
LSFESRIAESPAAEKQIITLIVFLSVKGGNKNDFFSTQDVDKCQHLSTYDTLFSYTTGMRSAQTPVLLSDI